MMSCLEHRTRTSTRTAGLSAILAALALLLLTPRGAEASCNFVPGTVNEFRSAVGSTDRPFAAPGDIVSVGQSSTPCPLGDELLPAAKPGPGGDHESHRRQQGDADHSTE